MCVLWFLQWCYLSISFSFDQIHFALLHFLKNITFGALGLPAEAFFSILLTLK
jgi:hypothetical protein